MEETIRRTSARRNAVSQRKKSKPIYNYRIFRKILGQLIISGLILICILSAKNMDTPFTKQVAQGVGRFLNSNLDFIKTYESVNGVIISTAATVKALFKSASKSHTTSEGSGVKDNKKNTLAETTKDSKKVNETNKSSIDKVKVISPIASSINSLDLDFKSVKSSIKILSPVKGSISSAFGLRVNPITKKEEFHPGLDIMAVQGTPIYAAIAGNVIEARKGTTFGNFIRILGRGDIMTVYAHCSKLGVKKGQKVSLGQKIGEVGNTGMSSGAHLHFEVWKGERPVDPSNLLSQYKK